jgi:hypothetical protein
VILVPVARDFATATKFETAFAIWRMIRKSGNRFSLATNAKRLRGDHAQSKKLDRDAIP